MRDFYYGYSYPNKTTNFLDTLLQLILGFIVVSAILFLLLACVGAWAKLLNIVSHGMVAKSAFAVAGAGASVLASPALIYGVIALAAVVTVGIGIALIARFAKNRAEQKAAVEKKQSPASASSITTASTHSNQPQSGLNPYQQPLNQQGQDQRLNTLAQQQLAGKGLGDSTRGGSGIYSTVNVREGAPQNDADLQYNMANMHLDAQRKHPVLQQGGFHKQLWPDYNWTSVDLPPDLRQGQAGRVYQGNRSMVSAATYVPPEEYRELQGLAQNATLSGVPTY